MDIIPKLPAGSVIINPTGIPIIEVVKAPAIMKRIPAVMQVMRLSTKNRALIMETPQRTIWTPRNTTDTKNTL